MQTGKSSLPLVVVDLLSCSIHACFEIGDFCPQNAEIGRRILSRGIDGFEEEGDAPKQMRLDLSKIRKLLRLIILPDPD